MNTIETLTFSLEFSKGLLLGALKDISESDLNTRAVAESNRLNWQLGHLITSERGILGGAGCIFPELPPGFSEDHANKPEVTGSDAPLKWTLSDYMKLIEETRAASIAGLAKLTEAELDKPTTGRMSSMVPKIGNLFELAAQHFVMHSGQLSVIRRKLGKPVLF
jgi:hypothetical protein